MGMLGRIQDTILSIFEAAGDPNMHPYLRQSGRWSAGYLLGLLGRIQETILPILEDAGDPNILTALYLGPYPILGRLHHSRSSAGYLFGVIGRIQEDAPVIYLEEPDVSSWPMAEGPKQPVYRVSFSQKDICEGYPDSSNDAISIEICLALFCLFF